mgnify:CR=1 FL=1
MALWRLKDKVMRYSELKRSIPHITDKILTSQLRELEAEGFVNPGSIRSIAPKSGKFNDRERQNLYPYYRCHTGLWHIFD